jgi:hypothetical protein
MRSKTMRRLAIALAVVGAAAILLAIVYFVVPSAHLPSVLGPVRSGQGHHDKRGIAALVLGVAALVGAALMYRVLIKRRRRGSYM